ncbi:MAG: NRDE family protein [Fimbriimonadaceae bacterium]|nr:NRDE family protein [Chitinophagales bacterium]
MCLINFAFQYHPKYKFILVGNRDEFYNRPTKELHWWEDHPDILAGRDLKDGGTWMGMSRDGKIAVLTNYRDLKNIKNDAPSRGIILNKYLSGEIPLDEFHIFLKTQGRFYNGFSLLYGTTSEFYYFANKDERWQMIMPGIYGLSNAFLDTAWTKLVQSKKMFTELIETDIIDEQRLINMMHNTGYAEDNSLPLTGIPLELEKKLSAMFIETENYGSRLTTFISIDKKDIVVYHEKSYHPPGDAVYTFQIQKR